MKALLLFITCNLILSSAFSQFVYKIKADSIRMSNDSCNAEMILENSTKNVKGFLFNKGNGRTEFKKGLTKLNDSTYVIGIDTLRLNNGINTSSNIFIKNQYTSAQDANAWINGTIRTNSLVIPGTPTPGVPLPYLWITPYNPDPNSYLNYINFRVFSENGINSYLRFSGSHHLAFSDYVQIEGGIRLNDQTESFMMSSGEYGTGSLTY